MACFVIRLDSFGLATVVFDFINGFFTSQRWCEKLLGPEKAAGKVSARIEIGSRLPNLSWGHHQAVAWLDPKAIEAYAKQANNKTLQADALEITLRAERRLGQLLAESPKNTGAKGSVVTGSKREPLKDTTPTLADMGIDKKLSAHKTKPRHNEI